MDSKELVRWGFEWKGHDHGIHSIMADGYWTPWHIAAAHIAAQDARMEALESGSKDDDLAAILKEFAKQNNRDEHGDYAATYILPRYASDAMMQAGLYQICGRVSDAPEGEEDDDWCSLFSAWHDMVDRATQSGVGLEIDLAAVISGLSLHSVRAAMEARMEALEGALRKARGFVDAWPKGMPISYQREVLAAIEAALGGEQHGG